MRLPKIVLAGTAALALSLSLGACSLTVNGSGSSDSGSSAAAQAGQAEANGSDSGSQTNGSAASADGAEDGDDAAITDSTWKDIISRGERKEVSGSYSVQGAGETLNLVGDLETLTVQGASNEVAAENIDTLIVQGSNVTVYARSIDNLQISGAGVTVHWLGDDPSIEDSGFGNTASRLGQ